MTWKSLRTTDLEEVFRRQNRGQNIHFRDFSFRLKKKQKKKHGKKHEKSTKKKGGQVQVQTAQRCPGMNGLSGFPKTDAHSLSYYKPL